MSATILIIDDDISYRRKLKGLLEKEECNLITMSDDDEIFTALESREISVMIIEIHLQDVDGFELIQQAQEFSPHTEIIILTGEGTMESAIRAIQLGVHDYLLKSDSEQKILSSVASGIACQNHRNRKRIILEQMEKTLWALKDIHRIGEVSVPKRQVIIISGGVQVDLNNRKLSKGDTEVYLTLLEGKLFAGLLLNWGQDLSYTELATLTYGKDLDKYESAHLLRSLIYRLRKKLSAFKDGESWIKTVVGTGYVFETLFPLERLNEDLP
jgi:DNA-binding response OmpR family regulator